MKNLIETIVKKAVRVFWDAEIQDIAQKCSADEVLSYDLHTYFPAFVFVELNTEPVDPSTLSTAYRRRFEEEGGPSEEEVRKFRVVNRSTGEKMVFLSMQDKINAEENPLHKVVWRSLRKNSRGMLRDYMMRKRPSLSVLNGVEGWFVPLCNSDNFDTAESYNEYMHNVMFWESMLDASEYGPVMQRYSWVTSKLYSHVSDMEQVKQKVWREYPETREKQMNTLQKIVDVMLKARLLRHSPSVLDEPKQATLFPDLERERKLERLKVEIVDTTEKLASSRTRKEASERRMAQMQNDIEFFSSRAEEMEKKLAELKDMFDELMKESNDNQ